MHRKEYILFLNSTKRRITKEVRFLGLTMKQWRLVKGLTQDIAGNVLGILELGEIYEEVFLMAIVALFFVTKNPMSYVVGIVAALIVFFIMIVIDNVFPRVKWNNMLWITWGVTLSLAGSNFLILTMLKMAGI